MTENKFSTELGKMIVKEKYKQNGDQQSNPGESIEREAQHEIRKVEMLRVFKNTCHGMLGIAPTHSTVLKLHVTGSLVLHLLTATTLKLDD